MLQRSERERRCLARFTKVSFVLFFWHRTKYFSVCCKLLFTFLLYRFIHFLSYCITFCVNTTRNRRKLKISRKTFFFVLWRFFRVYKKTSSNQLLTLYLGTRELVSRAGVVDPIKGIIYVDPKIIESNQKVYCQLTLTFRWEKQRILLQ